MKSCAVNNNKGHKSKLLPNIKYMFFNMFWARCIQKATEIFHKGNFQGACQMANNYLIILCASSG